MHRRAAWFARMLQLTSRQHRHAAARVRALTRGAGRSSHLQLDVNRRGDTRVTCAQIVCLWRIYVLAKFGALLPGNVLGGSAVALRLALMLVQTSDRSHDMQVSMPESCCAAWWRSARRRRPRHVFRPCTARAPSSARRRMALCQAGQYRMHQCCAVQTQQPGVGAGGGGAVWSESAGVVSRHALAHGSRQSQTTCAAATATMWADQRIAWTGP